LTLVAIVSAVSPLAASRLTNVSVRTVAGGGSDTLIVGFNISGVGTKQMLVRGIGPSLAQFGVPGVVGDPRLQLFSGAVGSFATNEDWGGSARVASAFSSVGAFALPADSRDAAILGPLPAGSYSAHLLVGGNSGIALVEVYDADVGSPATQIGNVSARSLAGAGAAVLTVGFAISGDSRQTVLIRAVGPTLTGFGVEGALANPTLRLFSSRGTELGLNDDWPGAAGWEPAFASVGAFALAVNSRDSALLVNLPPGTYTAQASGGGGANGVALIEVYDVPTPPVTSYVLQPVENFNPPIPRTGLGASAVTPAVLTQARPAYPFDLRRAGLNGEALIDFIVDVSGRVIGAYALRASDIQFADAALTAVRQWTFRPGRNAAGEPIAVHMQVPIIFDLN